MHRSVELELEEVDRLHDEQLLRKANVSPFFTSAQPPFAMPHELDFSPQAIPRAEEEITASALSRDASLLVPLLNLDGPDPSSDSTSSLSWSSELDPVAPLAQVPSWHHDLDADLHDESAGMLHTHYAMQINDVVDDQRFRCDADGSSSLFGHLQTSDQGYKSDHVNVYSVDQSNAFAHGRQSVFAQRGSNKSEPKHKRRDDRDSVRRSPYHPDDLTMAESDDHYCHATAAECDARLHSLHDSPNSSSARSYLRVRESCARHARSSVQPYGRPLATQRVMREKLFPLQHMMLKSRSYRAQSSAAARPASARSDNKMFQMIPFPMEALSISSTEPSCAVAHTQDSQPQDFHETFKKHSPLPDAHRTSKMKRANQRASLFALASPLTVLTKKLARDSTKTMFSSSVLRMPGAPTTASSSFDRLYGALQPSRQHRSLNVEYASPRHSEMWYRSDKRPHCHHHRSRCAVPMSSSSFAPAVLIPLSTTSPPPLPKRKIGAYSPTARRARIERYHEKRKQLVFHKRIKYACRKRLAIACPRVKGRFVRKQALQDETPAAPSVGTTP